MTTMVDKEVNNKSALASPVAKCSICGRISNAPASIGKECRARADNNQICPGVLSSILYPENWHECDICKCTGRIDDMWCECCAGCGWIQV